VGFSPSPEVETRDTRRETSQSQSQDSLEWRTTTVTLFSLKRIRRENGQHHDGMKFEPTLFVNAKYARSNVDNDLPLDAFCFGVAMRCRENDNHRD